MKIILKTRLIRSLCALALFALSVIHPPAFAQEEITIATGGVDSSAQQFGRATNNFGITDLLEAANAFTTGNNAAGYTLSEVGFNILANFMGNAFTGTSPGSIQVAIHEYTSTLVPGDSVGSSAMLAQASVVIGANSVTFSPAVSLDPSTPYFVVFSTPGAPTSGTHVYLIQSSDGTMPATLVPTDNGWSVAAAGIIYTSSSTAWTSVNQYAISLKATATPGAPTAPDFTVNVSSAEPGMISIPFSEEVPPVSGNTFEELTITFSLASSNSFLSNSLTMFTGTDVTSLATATSVLEVTGDTVTMSNSFGGAQTLFLDYTVTNTAGVSASGVITIAFVDVVKANPYTVTLTSTDLSGPRPIDLPISASQFTNILLDGSSFGLIGVSAYTFTTNGTGDAGGTLTVTDPIFGSDPVFHYTPVAGFAGTETFSYTAIDGDGTSDTSTISIVVPAAAAPVAAPTAPDQSIVVFSGTSDEITIPFSTFVPPVSGNTFEELTITFSLGSSFSFAFTSFTAFTGTDATTLATATSVLEVTGDTVTFNNAFGSGQSLILDYTVTNTAGDTASGVITITFANFIGDVMANPYTVTITDLSELPTVTRTIPVTDVASTILDGTQIAGSSLTEFTFSDIGTGDAAVGESAIGDQSGTLVVTNPTFDSGTILAYTPVSGFAGTETFDYTVSLDGKSDSSQFIFVVPAAAPVAAPTAPDFTVYVSRANPSVVIIPFSEEVPPVSGNTFEQLSITLSLTTDTQGLFSSFNTFMGTNPATLATADDVLTVTENTVTINTIFGGGTNFDFDYTVTNTNGVSASGVITIAFVDVVMANPYTVTLTGTELSGPRPIPLAISENQINEILLNGSVFPSVGPGGFTYTTNDIGTASGTLTVVNPSFAGNLFPVFHYTPVAGFVGTEVFDYTATSSTISDTSQLSIVVPAVDLTSTTPVLSVNGDIAGNRINFSVVLPSGITGLGTIQFQRATGSGAFENVANNTYNPGLPPNGGPVLNNPVGMHRFRVILTSDSGTVFPTSNVVTATILPTLPTVLQTELTYLAGATFTIYFDAIATDDSTMVNDFANIVGSTFTSGSVNEVETGRLTVSGLEPSADPLTSRVEKDADDRYAITVTDTHSVPRDIEFQYRVIEASGIPAVTLTHTIHLVAAANQEQVTAVVSAVARAIVSSTVSAVAGRIRNIAGGGVNVAGVNIGGVNLNNTNLASAVQTNAQAFATNSAAMKTLLGNSDVSFPLNAAGSDGSDGGVGSVAVWASGEYSDVSGDSKAIDWDGELSGFHLGIDGKIQTDAGNQIVIGAAVSALESEVDYTDETTPSSIDKGIYQIDMITTTPYIGFHSDAFDLWASVGLGDGEIKRTPESGDKTNDDVTQTSYAIGGGAQLVSAGNTWLRFNGEAMQSKLDIDSDGDNDSGQTINLNRVRMAMELGLLRTLESGGVFKPSIEFGVRYDGGDGETGTGIELGGQLAYYSATGFTAQGNARVLLAHDGGYEEWGIQGTVRKESGHDGQGLAFHLTPAYGDVNSGVSQLLAQGLSDDADNTIDSDYHMNLTSRLGYGIAMRNSAGMLTPYTEMVLGTTNQYRMGINWKPSKAFNLTLLSEQSEQNAIRLQGAINF